jgi:hypothetical protein
MPSRTGNGWPWKVKLWLTRSMASAMPLPGP